MGRRNRRDEVTALFAQALDGDEHAELELGRRWLDDGDSAAERAAHALAAAALVELERDPVYRAWTDASPLPDSPLSDPLPPGPPLSARVAAWARPEPARSADARLTPGRHRRT
jgi:hypothetical protein